LPSSSIVKANLRNGRFWRCIEGPMGMGMDSMCLFFFLVVVLFLLWLLFIFLLVLLLFCVLAIAAMLIAVQDRTLP